MEEDYHSRGISNKPKLMIERDLNLLALLLSMTLFWIISLIYSLLMWLFTKDYVRHRNGILAYLFCFWDVACIGFWLMYLIFKLTILITPYVKC